MRLSAVPLASILPSSYMLIRAFFSLTTTPGSMVKTDSTDNPEPLMTYTKPSFQTVGSLILPETSIISHLATGTCGLSNSVSSSSVLQAVNKLAVSIKNNNFFIFNLFKIIQRQSYR